MSCPKLGCRKMLRFFDVFLVLKEVFDREKYLRKFFSTFFPLRCRRFRQKIYSAGLCWHGLCYTIIAEASISARYCQTIREDGTESHGSSATQKIAGLPKRLKTIIGDRLLFHAGFFVPSGWQKSGEGQFFFINS
mgnify:CR=1 FL=1